MAPEIGIFTQDVTRFAAAFGPPGIVSWYQSWGARDAPDRVRLEQARTLRALPMICWEPWDPARPKENPFPLAEVARGKHDAYITSWAVALRGYQKPVLLRFAHEMNGDWYPWGQARPDVYLEAWYRVRTLFVQAGNVRLVWNPNVSYPGSWPVRRWYPGDDMADFVALDGYCWGSPWVAPAQLFGPTAREVAEFTQRPLFVAETACHEDPRKPGWIEALGRMPVEAVVWFDEKKERDWRVASSRESAKAFRSLLRRPGGRE